MVGVKHLKITALSVAAVLGLAACGGASIDSPGEGGFPDQGGSTSGGGSTTSGGGSSGGGAVSCPTGTTQSGTLGTNTVCQLSGALLANVTLPRIANVVYALSGQVQIGADVGGDGNRPNGQRATLTIQPGVTVFGSSGADFLVVNRGSQIIAEGTASQPIIFTSRADLAGTANPVSSRGQWGGIIINGRAPINSCPTTVTGGTAACEAAVEGTTGAFYGGDQPNDTSGSLRYIQVRYAGFEVSANNELNGITFAGVGSGTRVEFVQVHNNADDGIEFFGGTVNVRNIVLTGMDDDSLDWDAGWTGSAQFVLIRQTEGSGDYGIEADNNNGSNDRTPRSNPTISNMTIIGANRNDAVLLRRGTDASINNTILTGAAVCLDIDENSTAAAAPSFNSVLFSCPTAFREETNVPRATIETLVNAGSNNRIAAGSLVGGVFPGPVEQAVPARNPTTLGSFFTAANYIGAFSPTENESNSWASGWTFNLFQAPGCPTGTTEDGTLAGQRRCVLSGTYTGDLRLPRGNIYQLNGIVQVGRDVGADGTRPNGAAGRLIIDAGVTVASRTTSDRLIVTRGSQLIANGTAAAPVIFTAFQDVQGTEAANARGLWGGIIINGRAPINSCPTTVTGGTAACEALVEGADGTLYGGALPNDSSGRLSYVQVKYAGFEVSANNELNGITFAGVGSGTEVNNLQVHNNADDGVEFFGGSVSIKYLVLTGIDDDSIDWDAGWNGSIQFAIVLQSEGSGDTIIEADNNNGSNDRTPRSIGTVSNFTFVGANRGPAILIRRGTDANIVNGIATGSPFCLDIDENSTAAQNPLFASVAFACPTAFVDDSSVNGAATAAIFNAGTNNQSNATSTLTNRFINGANEAARPAFDVTTLNASLPATGQLVPVTYIGAVRDVNDTWWRGWTCGLETTSAC